MDFEELNSILETGTRQDLEKFCDANNLTITNNTIYFKDSTHAKEQIAFWDKRQLIKKINLNS